MNIESIIKSSIKANMGLSALELSKLGNGSVGSVYKVLCDTAPETIAVKVSSHPAVMKQEYRMLSFLREKTESKIPRVYYFEERKDCGIIAMEYINGVSGESDAVKNLPDKVKLANSIVDNLITLQKVKGDKFGPYDAPTFNSWREFYKGFADEILEFSKIKHSEGRLDAYVLSAVERSFGYFNEIFGGEDFLPTLIHGDYWMPNFIIDPEKAELLSVVDPFNVMWADPEYELFALDVGYGIELGLYRLYKSKVQTTKYCDVKLELYALYSEILWYKKLGSIDHSFLRMRAERLIGAMDRFNLI
ncbi:MAG: fructosamine kinase family protein [Clostridia bacterium]|nr:fructosamine kinase family protein [Clostridia bacterium]